MPNLDNMTPFQHRGVTYYADDSENVYDAEGKLLGYICSRGAQYGWGALIASPEPATEDDFEFARGNGIWEAKHVNEEVNDPAMESLLEAHAHLCGVCQGRGKVLPTIHSAVRVPCSYCEGKGTL